MRHMIEIITIRYRSWHLMVTWGPTFYGVWKQPSRNWDMNDERPYAYMDLQPGRKGFQTRVGLYSFIGSWYNARDLQRTAAGYRFVEGKKILPLI